MSENQRIAELERQLEELQAQHDDLRRQLTEARSDQWQARIEDLEVQAHLGAMEAQDTLDPLVEQLRNAWLEARQRFDSGASTASDVIDQLRDGFEQAGRDIRDALSEVRASVKQ
jgi:predicted nuclease with TOPRIM domain